MSPTEHVRRGSKSLIGFGACLILVGFFATAFIYQNVRLVKQQLSNLETELATVTNKNQGALPKVKEPERERQKARRDQEKLRSEVEQVRDDLHESEADRKSEIELLREETFKQQKLIDTLCQEIEFLKRTNARLERGLADVDQAVNTQYKRDLDRLERTVDQLQRRR